MFHAHSSFTSESDSRPESEQESGVERRLILITGTPGSGKRAVGYLLVDEWSFVYLDLDNRHANARFLGRGVEGLREELEENLEPGQDMVVTWNPGSKDALPMVREMQGLGFEWIWFDSDRGTAFGAVRAFGASIRYTRRFPRPRFVDTFASDGSFRPLAGVLADVLTPAPRAQPRLSPTRALRDFTTALQAFLPSWRSALAGARPIGTRARWAFSSGVAVAAAAAVAIGAHMVGGFGGADQPSRTALAGASKAQPAALPRRGRLVSGRTLAGVRVAEAPNLAGVHLGDTKAAVRAEWGHKFTVCAGCNTSTWFYLYPSGDPVGAGVKFRGGRVTAVFTLGMTMGWRAEDGIRVGQVLSSSIAQDSGRWVTCNGYSAKVHAASGNAVTSILTIGPTVYGFALTRPNESICH